MNYEVFEDVETQGTWRVEGSNVTTGEVSITIFAGARAEQRAREYHRSMTDTEPVIKIVLKNGQAIRLHLNGLEWDYDAKRGTVKGQTKSAVSEVPESIGGKQ